ncbi:hypothetical protein CBM2634_U70023 [Cupriavidus taiwanensis]|uniref:Uncharacterized protein n=1 Tax=Cupriavidus taiwanensis TaxID=164546 RepID=A0A375JER5_9BURK|nr:hypothetical protein CBM2634_U70023 [Cupriavidus taiwanensis]
MQEERLGAVLRLLTERGFVPTGHRRGRRSFEGLLSCAKGGVKVELAITDWTFLTYPTLSAGVGHRPVLWIRPLQYSIASRSIRTTGRMTSRTSSWPIGR